MAHVKINITPNVAVGENIVNTVGLQIYQHFKIHFQLQVEMWGEN